MRNQLPYLLTALVIGAVTAFLVLSRCTRDPGPAPVPPVETDRGPQEDASQPDIPAMPEMDETVADRIDPFEAVGEGARSRHPGQLVGSIGDAFEKGDFEAAARLIGSAALTPENRERLAALAAAGPLRLSRPEPAREVGEMEVNRRARWALHLEGAEPGRDRIFFDLARKDGRWSIESMTFPPSPGDDAPRAVIPDSLGTADAFLQATLAQDFELAKAFVDTGRVSDAKIAGLCILFEEGHYRLRAEKPLRGMFQRDTSAGYLANVNAGEDGIAQFSMTLEKDATAGWRITEINLDDLLADYARRVAGGDVYYTPLLKNPKGGDTLVLYFDFDADKLSPRTERQLEIVADILRLDPGKKLTISGHTDALGTEDYNQKLSARRADAVKAFLAGNGVAEDQIVTLAEGQTQPRRPNFTASGEDNPEGRRVNRRSEIYLDF